MSLYNCGGQSINCSYAFWDGAPISIDPDIAGLGVLLSFIITTGITITAVILAYVSESLPENTLNPIDKYLLQQLHTSWHSFLRFFNLPSLPTYKREARILATQRFILTLSDQQLVTGLAILVTLAIKRCTTSSWNYQIVLDLAWFSALTHITTLVVLRDYLSKNARTRLWRIIAMGCMLLLLIVFMILQTFVNIFEFPAMPFQCQLISKKVLQDVASDEIVFIVAVVLFWAVYFGSNLLAVFSNSRVTLLGWLVDTYWARVKKQTRLDRVTILQHSIARHSRRHPRRSLWVEWNCAFRYYWFVRANFAQSFLWEILWMLALFGYCVAQVSTDRWGFQSEATGPVLFQEGENSLGFGQIVALFLIALPFLGLVEAFSELEPKGGKVIVPERPQHILSEPKLPPIAIGSELEMPQIAILSDPTESNALIRPDEGIETPGNSISSNPAGLEAQDNVHVIAVDTSRTPEEAAIQIGMDPPFIIKMDNDITPELSTEHLSTPPLAALPSPQVTMTSSRAPIPHSISASSQALPEDNTIPKIFRFTRVNDPYTSPFIGHYLMFLIVCMIIGFGLAETYYCILTNNITLEFSTLALGVLFGIISGAPSMG